MPDENTPGREDRSFSGSGRVALEFVELARRLLDAATVHDVLDRVVLAAKAVIDGADMVSVTVRAPDGTLHTPAETAPLATQLDALQYQLDQGPCVAATRTPGLGVVKCDDLASADDFPEWGPAAADAGVHSVLTVGLFTDADLPRIGALNLYSFRPGGLDDVDRDVALVLAAHASTALASTRATSAAEIEVAQLQDALLSRDVIGQAKGILMERRGISADEAFAVLRVASQSLNVKLAHVAQTVATHRSDV